MVKGYVYILKNLQGKNYIGSTTDIHRRIKDHIKGNTRTTCYRGPWKLVFFKEYPDIKIARKIERRLKKFKSKKIIDKIIAEKNIKLGIKGIVRSSDG